MYINVREVSEHAIRTHPPIDVNRKGCSHTHYGNETARERSSEDTDGCNQQRNENKEPRVKADRRAEITDGDFIAIDNVRSCGARSLPVLNEDKCEI